MKQKLNDPVKKNEEYIVKIVDYGSNGEGIAKIDNFTIFIPNAIKNEKCKIHITKVLSSHAFAKLIEVIEKSPFRVDEIDCKTYNQCGGCNLRHIKYEETLKIKQEKIQNLVNKELYNLSKLKNSDQNNNTNCNPHNNFSNNINDNIKSNLSNNKDDNENNNQSNEKIIVNKTIGMDDPFYYRNKAIFPVSKNGKVGIYKFNSHEIIPFEECKIQTKVSQEIARYIVDNWNNTFYDEETHTGLLRNIMIREGFSTREIMVCLVQNGTENLQLKNAENDDDVKLFNKNNKIKNYNAKNNIDNIYNQHHENFLTSNNSNISNIANLKIKDFDISKLTEKFPNIKSIVVNVNTKKSNVILSQENIVIYGNEYIEDTLCNKKFLISANSFYQVNPVQTEKIYNLAIDEAKLKPNETLCDLYCGVGTIGIIASDKVKKVYGIEINENAILDAKKNAELNGISNIEFINGDVEFAFDKLLNNGIKPNVVIVDPPRKGLDKQTISNLNKLNLERVVYISCNPATLVRDLSMLSKNYEIKSITPIDNFCFTAHVESVTLLEIKKKIKS